MSTDAYRKCSKCGKTPVEDGGTSFHRFPKPGKTNIERARAWANFCWPDKDWQSVEELTKLYTSNKVLCKRHFEESCFTDSSNKNLGKFSVPSIEAMVPIGSYQAPILPIPSIQHHVSPDAVPSCSHDIHQASVQVQPSTEVEQVLEQKAEVEHPLPSTSIKIKKKKGILNTIGVKQVGDLTPREQKLYKICQKNIKEIRRIKNELKKKKSFKIDRLLENECVKNMADLNLSNSFIILLQNQLKNCKRQKKGRRYTIDQKIMALTLYKKSPACYRLLRRLMTLPCQSTVKKLLNKIPLVTGINKHIFKTLKGMADQQLTEENIVILSFDEMAIRKNLFYDIKKDTIEGFQDHGNHERSPEIACNALVFMLAGVRKKWKQPIAFYFSGKSITAGRLSVIIKEILHECFQTGLNVVATVCDLSTVNIKALELLGSTKEKPYFNHEGHEVVTILDPPHLLKCTRNQFLAHDVEITSDINVEGTNSKGVAKWEHLETFYQLDQDLDLQKRKFVFAPALTEQHIRPNSKQKMRVKLAAQVFSHTVTAGILTNIALNKLPAEAHATATLLSKFDELFDALNADTPDLRGGKPYSTNMTRTSPHISLFQDMRKFITNMKFKGSNSPPPSQLGWIRTMNAVERLWGNLNKMGITTLSTRRLNQDPLENCFGCIRYHCGSNDNPTIGQFIAGIKTAIINNLRHTGTNKNCEDDDSMLGNNLKSFLLPEKECEPEDFNLASASGDSDSSYIELESLEAEASNAIEQASPEAQACAYVCGFIYKKIKHNSCDTCNNIFLIPNVCIPEPVHLFTNFKEYDVHNNLKYVNVNFVQCLDVCSSIVNLILSEEAHKKGIKYIIMNALAQVDFEYLRACPQHFDENVKHIKLCTFFICVKRFIVLKNRSFSEDERNRSLKKKIRILQNK